MTKLERVRAKLVVGWDDLRVHEAIALVPGLSVRERAVLHALVAHANRDDRTCFVGVRALATLGMNKDTASSVLAELRGKRLVAGTDHHRGSPKVLNLGALPPALIHLIDQARTVSGTEGQPAGERVSDDRGQSVSESEGHVCPSERDSATIATVPSRRLKCPLPPVEVSPPSPPSVRTEGTEGSLKEEEGRCEGSARAHHEQQGWGLAPPGEPEDKPPPSATRTAKPAKARRWTRVPESWQPNEHHRQLADELGVNVETEVAKFRDHEFAKAKRDANATFRNWLREAGERLGSRTKRHAPQPTGGYFDSSAVGQAEWLGGSK